jgi:isochorismate hydrolase
MCRKVVNSGTVSLIRLSKDHYDAFTNPELELKVAELGIDEVFMTGLVDEVCIYRNALGFSRKRFPDKRRERLHCSL